MKRKDAGTAQRHPFEKPVYTVAPDLAEPTTDSFPTADERPVPLEPPDPLGLPIEPPVFRPLKVYAFDPSLGRTPGNVMTIPVRYEKLRPGPVGERVSVIDYDSTRDCFYDPVDLDDPLIAIRGGLDPSESDPHFHQQMAYAVTSETLRRVESAVGRTVCLRTGDAIEPIRIRVYPHGMNEANAYATLDDGRIMLGYFRAAENATGRTIPGQVVFNCLSHDVIVHTAMHAIVRGLRPDLLDCYLEADDPSDMDLRAMHEGLCDTAALLLHFSYREAVIDTIQRTAGSIHRARLDAGQDIADESTRIQAEIRANNPLLAMGQGFGEAIGQTGGLRSALGRKADPKDLEELIEPHARGGILVAAIFDAFFSVYLQQSVDLLRIYRAGGGRLDGGDLPAPLAERLFGEADSIAARVFDTMVRALDYCPPCNLPLGDFLRACITADYEHSPTDRWGVRDSLMQAFRRRGINAPGAPFFSEQGMRWPLVDADSLAETRATFKGLPEPDEAANAYNRQVLAAFVKKNMDALGLDPAVPVDIRPLEVARVPTPDNDLCVRAFTTAIQRARSKKQGGRTGVRLVFDRAGMLRYAIRTGIAPRRPSTART